MGKVYTFGHNMNGQLGLGDTKNHSQPDIVRSILKKNIITICAGWSHSFIMTEQGDLYACGSGKYGEL
jgi:alpha-tubulin suppressor-like RCC1 family protein